MTREELEDKIKNEEIVWRIFGTDISYVQLNNRNYIIPKQGKYKNWLVRCNDLGDIEYGVSDLDETFNTAEEAKHYLKYGNVIREEKLPFVTWNEFKNREKDIVFEYNCSIVFLNIIGNEISLMISGMPYLNRTWEITEKNFYKAYEYAKELFLKERE